MMSKHSIKNIMLATVISTALSAIVLSSSVDANDRVNTADIATKGKRFFSGANVIEGKNNSVLVKTEHSTFSDVSSSNQQESSNLLTDSHFKRQIYLTLDQSRSAGVLFFHEDKTGYEAHTPSKTDDSSSKKPFNWSIINNKLVIDFYTRGYIDRITFDNISPPTNEYLISGESTRNSTFTAKLYKAKPLNLDDLNNKIFLLDTTGDEDYCTERTMKVIGTTGSVKERCGGQIYNTPITFAMAVKLDNTVYMNGINGEGQSFTNSFSLVKGEINDDIYLGISAPDSARPIIEIYAMKITDKEVGDPINNNEVAIIPIIQMLLWDK